MLNLMRTMVFWDYITIHNPDFIRVSHPSPVHKDPIIMLVPDERLKAVVTSSNPADRKVRENIPDELLTYILKKEDIPLDNFNVSCLRLMTSPYDTRGMSMITSCYRDLLLYDKIREAEIVQADNFINPLTLVKIGDAGGTYRPTQDDIRMFQESMLDGTGDQNYTLITHGAVDIQKISNAGQTLDMSTTKEEAKKNIMMGLYMPTALFDQEYGSYANGSIGLQVLRDRYTRFQLQLKNWIEKKILEPIAKIQDFYEIVDGEQKLIVPEVNFGKINLKETDTYLTAISGMIEQGEPGSGKISKKTAFELLDVNYEEELKRLRLEIRDDLIRKKELTSMQNMDIVELKSITETTIIRDSREEEALEKSLDIEQEGTGMDIGGMGGMGGMGGEDMEGDMGIEGDMGMEGDMGDMEGGDLGGPPGDESAAPPTPEATP